MGWYQRSRKTSSFCEKCMVEKKKGKRKEKNGENMCSIYSQFSWSEIVGAKNMNFLPKK
jgi:hypothetical protein